MGRSVSCFVPFLPTQYLSPNRGERREGRVPALIVESKRAMRGAWALWLLEQDEVRAIQEPFTRATVTLTVRCMDGRAVVPADGIYRPLDVGNAIYALKAGIDGIKDAGLIVDDDYQHLEAITGRIERVADRASEGVLVEVCEVAALRSSRRFVCGACLAEYEETRSPQCPHDKPLVGLKGETG